MKNVSKYKKSKTLCPDMMSVVKEFPFVCGLDIELTRKNKKFTSESWSFAETLLNQFIFIQNDSTMAAEIFQVFAIIGSFFGDIPDSPHYKQIVTVILDKIADNEDSHSHISFLSTLCMFNTFVKSFFFSDYFPLMFDNLMINDDLNNAFTVFTSIFLQVVNFNSPNVNKGVAFVNHVLDSIKKRTFTEKSISCACVFIAAFVEKVSKSGNAMFKKFQASNGINICYDVLIEVNSPSVKDFFKPLLRSYDGNNKKNHNFEVGQFIYEQFAKNTNNMILNSLLETIADVSCENSFDVKKMSESFKFIDLFNQMKGNKEVLISLIDILHSLVTRNYSESTTLLISVLKCEISDDAALKLSNTLSEGFNRNAFNINKSNMLEFYDFFVQTPIEKIAKLISTYNSFAELYVMLYKVSDDYQNKLFAHLYKVVDASESIDAFIPMITSMLLINFDTTKLKIFTSNLATKFSLKLFSALNLYFEHGNDCILYFLKIDGFSLIKPIFNNKDVPEEAVIEMLISMSQGQFSNELNQAILELKPDNRIFSLSKKAYKAIILDQKRMNPIRLPVLVPFLDFPPYTDLQVDAINLATYALPIYLRLGKEVPYLPSIAQRYSTSRQAKMILDNYAIEQYVEPATSDFPYYEFYPQSNSSRIVSEIPFFGISFWFKTNYKYHQNLTIFRTNDVSLTLKNDTVTITWGDNVEKQKITIGEWHYVFISSNAWMFGALVNVLIDKAEYRFEKEQIFKQVEFGAENSPNDGSWFISANIRVFVSLFQDMQTITTLRDKGPGFLNTIKTEMIIGLHSGSFTIGDGVVYTLSQGISTFLNQPLILSKIFESLRKANTTNELIYEVQYSLITAKNNHLSCDMFWYYLFASLKYKKDILNADVYTMLINFLVSSMKPDECIDILRSALIDVELWAILKIEDQRKLIDSIKGIFKSQDFRSYIVPQGWIPFFLLVALKCTDKDTTSMILLFIAELCLKNNIQSGIDALLMIAFYQPSTEKFSSTSDFAYKLIEYFTEENETSYLKNINPQWLKYYVETSNDDIGCAQVISLITKLRETNEGFDIHFGPIAPKFVGNLMFWHHSVTLLTGKDFLGAINEEEIKNSYEKSLEFTLSVFLYSYVSLFLYSMSGKSYPESLEKIVKEGSEIFLCASKEKPEFFKRESVVSLLCLMLALPFGLSKLNKEEILSKYNIQQADCTINKDTLLKSIDVLSNAHGIDESMKNSFIEMLEIDSICRKQSVEPSFIAETVDYFVNYVRDIPNFSLSDPKKIIDFIDDYGIMDFLINVISANISSSSAGKLIEACIAYKPFIEHDSASYSLDQAISYFVGTKQTFTNESAKLITALLVENIYNANSVSYKFKMLKEFIELHKNNDTNSLETSIWMKVLPMSKEIVNEFPKPDMKNNAERSLAVLYYILTHEIDEKSRAFFNEIIESEEFSQKIKELVTEDCETFVSSVKKAVNDGTKDDDFGVSKLKEFITSFVEKQKKNEERKFGFSFDKEINEKESGNKLQEAISNVILQLLQITTFLSLRQNECFSLNVLLTENKAKQTNIEEFSPTAFRYGGFSKPYFMPMLLRPVLGNQIKIVDSSEEAKQLSKEIDLSVQSTNNFFVVHEKKSFVDPCVYSFSLLKSPAMLYHAFLKRFFKFGECKKTYNASIFFYNQKIPCIIFMMSPAILVLVHATKIGDTINLIGANEAAKNISFLYEVNDEEFGVFSSFNGHYVLIINPYNTYDFNVEKQSTLLIYRLNSRPVSLSFCEHVPEELVQLLDAGEKNARKKISSNFLKKTTLQDEQTLWANKKRSTARLVLSLNSVQKRDFFSKESCIIVPASIISEEPAVKFESEDVKKFASFCIPDALNRKKCITNQTALDDCVKLFGLKPKASTTEKKAAFTFEKLRHRYVSLANGSIYVKKNTPALYIYTKEKEEPITLFKSEYTQVVSLSASSDSQFIVIDYNFGISAVYQICYKRGELTGINEVGSIITEQGSVSSISSEYMLCATVQKNILMIWDFMKQTIHRVVEFPFHCLASVFDENDGYIWIWGKTEIALVTINGTFCSMYSFDNQILNVKPRVDLSAYVLLEDSTIERVEFDENQKFLSVNA